LIHSTGKDAGRDQVIADCGVSKYFYNYGRMRRAAGATVTLAPASKCP
jgi:hypothetical protein